jgi:hypothetical protein
MPRFAVQVLFPEWEAGNQLGVAADILSGYLFELSIENELLTVSPAELNRLVAARENLQEAVIVFRPRR